MAQPQLAQNIDTFAALEAFFPAPAVSYQDAIRSIALEHISGEDPAERTAGLARSFNMDCASVQIDVDETIDAISNA